MLKKGYLRLYGQTMKILELIENERVSATDIACKLGMSNRNVYRKINDLRELGYDIRSTKKSKRSHYYIVKKENKNK